MLVKDRYFLYNNDLAFIIVTDTQCNEKKLIMISTKKK